MSHLIIESAIPSELLLELQTAVINGRFEDGRNTAHGLAKSLKNNQQLDSTPYLALLDTVGKAIVHHPLLQSYAIPQLACRPMVNRYAEGMEYGLHVDSAYLADIRTDLSYTLFLDDPSSYDGGELIVSGLPRATAFKLSPGTLVIYPTGALHRVAPVTRGSRHAVVGWIQSRLRSSEQREIYGKLCSVRDAMKQNSPDINATLQLQECLENLLRMWGN